MGLIVVLGLCLTFTPIVFLFSYVITKSRKKTKFDKHLEIVKSKKGKLGLIIAYATKIFIGISLVLIGLYMSEELENEEVLQYAIVSVVISVVLYYFDKRNKR